MKIKNKIKLLLWSIFIFLVGCSTTKKLPEGEVLYTGISKLTQVAPPSGTISPEAQSQVEGALDQAPNNSLFGSSYYRIPFPFGLWMYNWFKTDKERGFKRWLYNRLASEPVTINGVDPKLRTSVAETLLDDNGYFNGKVKFEVIPNKKNPRKAKIAYWVDYHEPYRYDSIQFMYNGSPSDSIIRAISSASVLKKGDLFSVNKLEDERTRISKHLRDYGYYYFRPDLITYEADSTRGNHQIMLRMQYEQNAPKLFLKPWRFGDVTYSINNAFGGVPNDTVQSMGMDILYFKKQPVRSRVLKRSLAFEPGELFSQQKVDKTQANLAQLSTFKYTELRYMPQDTLHTIDSIDVLIDTSMDLPVDGKIEFNVATKSNDQTGPGLIFGVTKRNFFKGGEIFNTQLSGSYEWYTGAGSLNTSGGNLINSYEIGLKSSLTFPRLIAPKFFHQDINFPARTQALLDINLLSRSGFFQMLNLTGEGSYEFQTSPVSTHVYTPFGLTYSYLMKTTSSFDSIMSSNEALALSFENQFIPYMSYTYTYDNSKRKRDNHYIWWKAEAKQAGNVLYGAMELLGNKEGTSKEIFGNPFSQFVKGTSDFRYYYLFNKKNILATRLYTGIIKAYLNSEVAPYGEQFYIGGANSIRAFQVRSIGPGSFRPAQGAVYSYLDQTGDIKLEANVEYRFPIWGDLNGAVFVDAGNIWKIKPDNSEGRGDISFRSLGRQVALGTGFGFRFDITFLVLRMDIGIPLHVPYDTTKKTYYNVTTPFFRSFAYHLAIGYPF